MIIHKHELEHYCNKLIIQKIYHPKGLLKRVYRRPKLFITLAIQEENNIIKGMAAVAEFHKLGLSYVQEPLICTYVKPIFRKLGIGTQLVSEVINSQNHMYRADYTCPIVSKFWKKFSIESYSDDYFNTDLWLD